MKSFLPMVGNGLNCLEAFGRKQEKLRGGYVPTDKPFSENKRREEIAARRIETHFMGADVMDRTLQEHLEDILDMLEGRGSRVHPLPVSPAGGGSARSAIHGMKIPTEQMSLVSGMLFIFVR